MGLKFLCCVFQVEYTSRAPVRIFQCNGFNISLLCILSRIYFTRAGQNNPMGLTFLCLGYRFSDWSRFPNKTFLFDCFIEVHSVHLKLPEVGILNRYIQRTNFSFVLRTSLSILKFRLLELEKKQKGRFKIDLKYFFS